MTGTTIALEELPWETWDDPGLADRSGVRWKLVFSGHRTPTGAMSVGLAEIEPGGVLPLHHHAPAEVYHVLEGEGRAEVEGETHELRPGRLLFIPADAKHRTINTGSAPLRCLFVFPTDSFEDVVYHFDE
jgi:quercetin dioxygenase-like cupin family protein